MQCLDRVVNSADRGRRLRVWHYQQQQDKPLTLYGNVDIRTVNLGFRVDGRGVADGG